MWGYKWTILIRLVVFSTKPSEKFARKKWEPSPNRGENKKCWRKKSQISQIASPRKIPVVPAIPSAPPCVIAPPPRVFFLAQREHWELHMLHFHLKPISTWPTCPLFSPTKTMAHKCRVFVLPPRDSCPNAPGSDDWCGFKTSARGA